LTADLTHETPHFGEAFCFSGLFRPRDTRSQPFPAEVASSRNKSAPIDEFVRIAPPYYWKARILYEMNQMIASEQKIQEKLKQNDFN
jgi:hypothetical protein